MMYDIEICNLRKDKMNKIYDFRVDRKSILGNPFYMKDESKRDEVCDKYEEYFYNKLIYRDNIIEILKDMISIYKKYNRLNLFCWCYPKRCHAEVIKDFIYKVVGEKDIDNKYINNVNIISIINKLRMEKQND